MNYLKRMQDALLFESVLCTSRLNDLSAAMNRQLLVGGACILSGIALVLVHVLHVLS